LAPAERSESTPRPSLWPEALKQILLALVGKYALKAHVEII
jgi:hypothetical protein